ncbi:MAG: UxaA family hydrolase [Actinomycetota bacterium]
MKPNALIIIEADNVAVTLEDVAKGGKVCLPDGREITAADGIPYSHKVALRHFERGEDIIKYGEVIGQASRDIPEGDWVHTHNLVVED